MATDRTITLDEVKQHNNEKSCWLVIHGNVYDVTAFLEEHPGGYDIILTSTAKDATKDFEEIGHSKSAKQLLEKYLIGKFEGGDSAPPAPAAAKGTVTDSAAAAASSTSTISSSTRMLHVLLPVMLLVIAVGLNMYASKKK